MAITSYSIARDNDQCVVTVISDLTGTIYYHWWLDGAYLGMTTDPVRVVAMQPGQQGRIECIDTNDADYDTESAPPAGYPARLKIWWVRSIDTDVSYYLVTMSKGGGSATTIAKVRAVPDRWEYEILTPRLDDQASYTFTIDAYDATGNHGTTITTSAIVVVRTPDAPDFTVSFNPATTRVTFTEA